MSNAGTTLLANLGARKAAGQTVSLDGAWRLIVDPYQTGYWSVLGTVDRKRGWFRDHKPRHEGDRIEYDFDQSPAINVPGDWNTQREDLFRYEGTVWYRRRFTVHGTSAGRRAFVHFGAVNHTCRVFLDGEELATHVGGFGPFAVELTDRLSDGEHSLVVMVDNRREPDRIPAMRTDWYNFGGIHRSVDLVWVPATFIRNAWISMAPDGSLVGEVIADGDTAAATATVSIESIGLRTQVQVNERFVVPAGQVAALDRWHPGRPVHHDVRFTLRADGEVVDSLTESVGFRTVATRGAEIVVNGEPIFLKGISMHAEAIGGGRRASGPDDAAALFDAAEALGANFVRLAHYQHDEAMVAEADRRGLMVWGELPVYWGIDWSNSAVLANALDQADELVSRDRNHAAVVLWSVANETLPGPERNAFLRALCTRVRTLDPTRLVTAALFTLPGQGIETHIDDPLAEHVDVIGVNQYYGWYYGDRAKIPDLQWSSATGKPLIFSELGAGAKAGHHGAETEIWTEEFQAAVYRAQIEMIAKQPDCAGLSPWILKDFRTPLRVLPGIQDGYNRKGLIDEEGVRKLAFDVLRDWYASL